MSVPITSVPAEQANFGAVAGCGTHLELRSGWENDLGRPANAVSQLRGLGVSAAGECAPVFEAQASYRAARVSFSNFTIAACVP